MSPTANPGALLAYYWYVRANNPPHLPNIDLTRHRKLISFYNHQI